MPLVLPTAAEYERMLSHAQRRRVIHRLLVDSRQIDELPGDIARRLYARTDQDCPELIAERRAVLETDYGLPYKGWTRHG